MLVYAKLLQKWNLEIQELAYDRTVTEAEYDVKFKEYQDNLQRLFKRLRREYEMSEDEFRALKDQSMMM